MSPKVDAIGNATALVVGSALATAPAVMNTPFYQSELWLSFIAVLGATVLVLTIINGVRTLIRNKKK